MTIGRQSTRLTTAMAQPVTQTLGRFIETINNGPRCRISWVRISMVFSPRAISYAQGCLTDMTIMASPPIQRRKPLRWRQWTGGFQPRAILTARSPCSMSLA